MTNTDNRMPATEALGEALAALNGEREQFRKGHDRRIWPRHTIVGRIYRRNLSDAEQAMQHLANSGWVLTPGPVVNAGEEIA